MRESNAERGLMERKMRTVTMTPEREALYKDARKRAQQILDICDSILNSRVTESRACSDANFPVAVFRQFCKNQPKALGGRKIQIREDDWYDWRESLLHAITEEKVPVPDDFDEVFDDVCKTELSERKAQILRMRLEDGLSYEEVGKNFGVTRERIRQLEVSAIRKLRRPDLRNRLRYGSQYEVVLNQHKTAQAEYDRLWLDAQKAAKEQQNAELGALRRDTDKLRAASKSLMSEISSFPTLEDRMKATSFETLDLSVRSYNCLKRYFSPKIPTAWDIANLSEDELMNVRNLGRKSIEEIEWRLRETFGHGFFR